MEQGQGRLKLIYIAGNEPFTQGPVSYRDAISDAKEHGIVLVEDDEVDAVEPDGHTSAPASDCHGADVRRAAPSTKLASGGNETVTSLADRRRT